MGDNASVSTQVAAIELGEQGLLVGHFHTRVIIKIIKTFEYVKKILWYKLLWDAAGSSASLVWFYPRSVPESFNRRLPWSFPGKLVADEDESSRTPRLP